MRQLIFSSIVIVTVYGHGLLTYPPSKNGGNLSIPLETSTNHFAIASYGIIDKAFFNGDHSETPWKQPGHFNYELARDLISGYPQTLHPCGCNAGDIENCAGVIDATGFGETTLGTTVTPPIWAKGSHQETAWNAWVNHAGGHIYMMCKKTDFDSCRDTKLPANPALATQAEKDSYLECVWNCFESHTLEWASTHDNAWAQKLQFQDDKCAYVTMTPETKVGKDGHLWRYTPIPDSLQVTNGGEGKCTWDSAVSFSNVKAREEFIASFGDEDVCDYGIDHHAPSDWHVFDKVVVPADLDDGEYLLSWRWDAYMADQMWTGCADVTVVSSEENYNDDECPTQPPISSSAAPTSTPDSSPVTPPSSPTSPTPTPPSIMTCPSDYTGLQPYNECTQFYHCVGGQITGNLIDCPAETLFDVDLQICNWDYLVICEGNPPPPFDCPSGYTGLFSHDDCTKYYHCFDGDFLGGVSDCPDGTLFNVDVQYCDWDYNVICETSPPMPTPTSSVAPTHTPSVSPTSSPTLSPTSSPAASPICEDARIPINYLGIELSCASIIILDACDVEVAQSHCPNSCNACPQYGCEDTIAPLSIMGRTYSCEDIQNRFKNDPLLLERKCDQFPEFAASCRDTCKICED